MCSCTTTYNLNRVGTDGEGTLVFVRPEHYSVLGTTSIRDCLEIVYEEFSILDNGFAKFRVGIRNRGGQHWWFTRGADVQISATPFFYDIPLTHDCIPNDHKFPSDMAKPSNAIGNGNVAPKYVGARTPVRILRGETAHLEFICPLHNMQGCQVVFAER